MPRIEDSARLVDQQIESNLLTPEAQPMTAWEGTGEALKGLLRPSAAAGRSLLIAAPGALELFGTGLTEEGYDAYYGWVDEVTNSAVDYWTPDAQTMGGAAQVVNTVSQVVGSVPQIVGAPEVFLTSAALDQPVDLIRQGVDADTATGVGLVNLGVNAIGLRVPPAFGSAIGTRLATGAGANLALGAGADVATAGLLQSGGYDDLAAGYNWRDPSRRMLDALMGAAFGLAPAAPKAAPSERNAILTARNAQHFQVEAAPGTPTDGASSVLHQDTLSDTIAQVLAGERVRVSDEIHAANFRAMTAPEVDYVSYRRALESGGRSDAKNPNSSAYGADQFTASTWRRVVASAKPAWAQGMTDAQLLAARADPAKSGEMAQALDAENSAGLAADGQPVTPQNLYAAHHFGLGAAKKFARAADDTPIERILSKEQIAANKYLRGKTKAEVLDNWDGRARTAGVDVPQMVARLEQPEAGAGVMLPDLTPAEAGRVIDERLSALDTLATTDLLSPEATAVLRREDAELVQVLRRQERYDSQGIIPADPLAKLSPVEVRRVTERRIEIRDQLERSAAAAGYANVAQNLRQRLGKIDADRDLVALADQLTGRRRPRRQVSIPAAPPREVVDWLPPAARDLAYSMQERERVYTALAQQAGKELDIPSLDAAARRLERPVTPTRRAPAPAADAAPAARQSAQRGAEGGEVTTPGQVAAEAPLQAAARMAEEAPETRVVVGQDADGQPVYSTLGDALETIENERQRAVRDAEAITAAANCAMRRAA